MGIRGDEEEDDDDRDVAPEWRHYVEGTRGMSARQKMELVKRLGSMKEVNEHFRRQQEDAET